MSEDTAVAAAPAWVTKNMKLNTLAIVMSSLTVVAGLAWNDAIKAIIDKYIPPDYKKSKNVWVKALYALIVTLIVVFMISLILSYEKKIIHK